MSLGYFIKPTRCQCIAGLTTTTCTKPQSCLGQGELGNIPSPIPGKLPTTVPSTLHSDPRAFPWLLRNLPQGKRHSSTFPFFHLWYIYSCMSSSAYWYSRNLSTALQEGNEKQCIFLLCFREKKICENRFLCYSAQTSILKILRKAQRFVEEIS